MKQCINQNQQFWFVCLSKSGYLYQMDIYLGRKQTTEFNLRLGEEVVLQLTKDLERFGDLAGVDLMDQHATVHRLDRKSSVRFYLRIFFDLMDIAYVNSYLIYNMKHTNKLSLLYYKIVVAKNPIQYRHGRERSVPMSRPSKRKKQPESIDNHGGHLPDYQTMRKQCSYCAIEGKENRTFVICLACTIPLFLVKEKNCSQKHHI